MIWAQPNGHGHVHADGTININQELTWADSFSSFKGSGTGTINLPAGFNDGVDVVGTVDSMVTGFVTVNDRISGVTLNPGSVGINDNFAERPVNGGSVSAGQTATIGFWQNNNGRALIESLNGGPGATQLSSWLAATFSNMYGANAGGNNLSGLTNSQVWDFYNDFFRRKKKEADRLGLGGPVKMDAQIFATALATYVTNQTLAGNVAVDYGIYCKRARGRHIHL